jgi:hypothetical protein
MMLDSFECTRHEAWFLWVYTSWGLIPSYRSSLLSQIENIPRIQRFKVYICIVQKRRLWWNPVKLWNPVNLYKKKAPQKAWEKVKRKHTSKGEKKNLGTRTKVQASIQPKRGGPQGGKGTTKYWNLKQLLEAYQLEKGKVNPTKCRRTLPRPFLLIIDVHHHKFRKYSTNPIVRTQQVVLGHGLLVENLFLVF